jgi:hypothetical protein
MSTQNFTESVQFELKQSGNLVDAYIVVGYRDTNRNLITGLHTTFVLSITGDLTGSDNKCEGAVATLSSKTETEVMSFGEYTAGETDLIW